MLGYKSNKYTGSVSGLRKWQKAVARNQRSKQMETHAVFMD